MHYKPSTLIVYWLKWIIVSICIGIMAGCASAVFLISLDAVTYWRENNQWLIAFLPIGGAIIGLLYHYFGKEAEAGNNVLIDVVHHTKTSISFTMAPLVYVSTLLTHLLGGSAGREGTALQMAAAISHPLSKPFKFTQKEISIATMAAIAAGFSSVFGTPLAGAVFGIEVCVLGTFNYKAIVLVAASSFIANYITHLWPVQHTTYHIGILPNITLANCLYVAAAGVAFGICAAFFCTSIHAVSTWCKRVIKFTPLRVFLGGIMLVLFVAIIGTTKYIGLGIPTIVEAFQQPLPTYDFVVKIIFTILTLAVGFKGGEVTPLFFIGATLGNALAYFIPLPLGLLSGIGFVAVLAAATNTPIACSILAVELFGFDCGIYAVIACFTAYSLSGYNSIYTSQLHSLSNTKYRYSWLKFIKK